MMFRNNDSMHSGTLRRAYESSEILWVLDALNNEQESSLIALAWNAQKIIKRYK